MLAIYSLPRCFYHSYTVSVIAHLSCKKEITLLFSTHIIITNCIQLPVHAPGVYVSTKPTNLPVIIERVCCFLLCCALPPFELNLVHNGKRFGLCLSTPHCPLLYMVPPAVLPPILSTVNIYARIVICR